MPITALVTTDTLSTWFTTINAIITDVNATLAINVIDADSDTKIQVEESTDEDIIRFDAAGTEIAAWAVSSIVMNETGANVDFRVETNNNAFMLYLDGAKDALVFGANTDASSTDTPFLIDYLARTATATVNFDRFKVGGTNAVTIPSGTTALATGAHFAEPNFTATGTITSAVNVYIAGAPSEGGTNNYALWVDSGATQLDGTLTVVGASTQAAITASGLITASSGLTSTAGTTALGVTTVANTIVVTGASEFKGGVIVNEAGTAGNDVRMESDLNAYMFYLDGEKNALVFGGNTDLSDIDAPFLIATKAITATANTNFARFKITQEGGAVTVPTGTTAIVASAWIEEPNITATGTVTEAASLYIPSAPSEAATNYALWVNTGLTHVDTLVAAGNATFSGSTVTMTTPTVALGTFTTSNTSVVANLNATKWNGAAKTVSTSAPSGGSAGDVWFRYVA